MSIAEKRANRTTVVMGSARGDGNTAAAVLHLSQKLGMPPSVADLSRLRIFPFEYGRHDDRDDFRAVIEMMLESDHVVFATPVYWYSMSSPMKAFFDRLTDLLFDPASRKIGRALAGRSIWLLATGTDEDLPSGFQEPFARTAMYFGMIWREAIYCQSIKGLALTPEALTGAERLAKLIVA
ncbi:MAG: NAD(P)H-dependent oxidoreductase [Sphingomonas sp.]|uniref:flavodoxin family protein n=1 Tax=Sphingomonas sp. TaxID=28214 RepID=UPI0025FA5097|nr:NAD(P)H-dependent oxidoreductase [Sphingomonas sp.]MBX9881282.1 NAD(P)H-dependent oxidoreductase [Sphingomonas sp.]